LLGGLAGCRHSRGEHQRDTFVPANIGVHEHPATHGGHTKATGVSSRDGDVMIGRAAQGAEEPVATAAELLK